MRSNSRLETSLHIENWFFDRMTGARRSFAAVQRALQVYREHAHYSQRSLAGFSCFKLATCQRVARLYDFLFILNKKTHRFTSKINFV